MNVLVIRLITSEEIIAQVDPESIFGKLKLINPAAIINRQDQTGKPTMGLADYLPMADRSIMDRKEVLLNESVILFTYKPIVELVNAYNQSFGIGIVLAPKAVKLSLT